MDCSVWDSERCKSIAEQAWNESDGDPEAMAQALGHPMGEKLGPGSGVMEAFVQGVCELGRYAQSAPVDDAVDAERQAAQVSRRVVVALLQTKLQQQLDALDAAQPRGVACAECGRPMASQGRRTRNWQSLLGGLELRRRYVYCERCEQGEHPSQRALGLPDDSFTARLEEAATRMATTVPYQMAVQILEDLCGVSLSEKAVQDMVERRAEAVHAHQGAEAKDCAPYQEDGLPTETPVFVADAVPTTPEVAYLELDGVVPLTREPVPDSELSAQDRNAKRQAKEQRARGGKGQRYTTVGREVKNAVLYDGVDCVSESPGRGCLLQKTYVSHLGPWMAFAALLWTELCRKGFHRAQRIVVLSDGAEWIRSLCAWLPVDTFLILDLYHAKRRVYEVAHALYGETDKATRWAKTQCERLEQGQAKEVITALRFLRPRRDDLKTKVDALGEYLRNNLDRMDYPTYRQMGLRVGSGAVESANYHVTGARLKLQGMRWTESGARDMSTLRADLFNGRWETRTRQILAA
jgi:hypothetical protein